jgi:hypothetical protein
MWRFFAGLGIGIVIGAIVIYVLAHYFFKKYTKMSSKEWTEWANVMELCGNNRRYTVVAEYDDGGEVRVIKG